MVCLQLPVQNLPKSLADEGFYPGRHPCTPSHFLSILLLIGICSSFLTKAGSTYIPTSRFIQNGRGNIISNLFGIASETVIFFCQYSILLPAIVPYTTCHYYLAPKEVSSMATYSVKQILFYRSSVEHPLEPGSFLAVFCKAVLPNSFSYVFLIFTALRKITAQLHVFSFICFS